MMNSTEGISPNANTWEIQGQHLNQFGHLLLYIVSFLHLSIC